MRIDKYGKHLFYIIVNLLINVMAVLIEKALICDFPNWELSLKIHYTCSS
jgi:hypothetical protein